MCIVGRRHKRIDCWYSIRRHPITQARRQRILEGIAVLVGPPRNPVVQVVLHGWVRFRQRSQVTISLITLPGDHEPERVPRGRGAATISGLEEGFADVTIVLTARRQKRYFTLICLG